MKIKSLIDAVNNIAAGMEPPLVFDHSPNKIARELEGFEVLVFDPHSKELIEVESVSINGRCIQINIPGYE